MRCGQTPRNAPETQTTQEATNADGPPSPHPHKNPLLLLSIRPNPERFPLSRRDEPLTLPPPQSCPLDLLIRRPFHPSSSLSSLNPFSFSSLRSRSALFAASWVPVSSACNSSIVCSKRSILSRPLETSSESCWACFSRRPICAWRSRTVRSLVRTERRDEAWLASWLSS